MSGEVDSFKPPC